MSYQTKANSWDVIIVGAGISGCTAGLLLADAGKKVLILERADGVGGRCRSFEHQGYTMEMGGHLLEDGAVTELHKKFGIDVKMPLTTDVQVWWKDRWSSPKELYQEARDDLRRISTELISMSWDDLEKLNDVTLVEWLRARTESDGIIELFGMLGVLDYMFNFDEIAASEALAMRKLSLEERGTIAFSQYPAGGTMGLIRPLAETFEERGGEIRTHSRVREILVAEGRVRGVEVEEPKVLPNEYPNGIEIEAPVVICTLPVWDLPSVLPREQIPEWYLDKIHYLGAHRCHWFGFYAGTDQSIMGLTLYGYDNLPRSGQMGGALEPSAYDPGLAPEGKHLVMCAGSSTEHREHLHDKDWLKVKMKEFEADMEDMFPDLKDHCLWKRWHVVDHFALMQKPGLVGSARPGYEIPGVNNLYLASETAMARGMGMDAATRVAISVAERILGRKIPEFAHIFHY